MEDSQMCSHSEECGERERTESTLMMRKNQIPFWKKTLLTFEEASAYSGIGISRLRFLVSDLEQKNKCDFVLYVQSRRLINRRKFDKFIDSCSYSI